MIFSFAATASLITQAQATQVWERDCGVVVGDILRSEKQPIPGFLTLTSIGDDGVFIPPKGFEDAPGVYCTRSLSGVFQSDYDVVRSGYSLYIYSANDIYMRRDEYRNAEQTLTVLEIVDGVFRFDVLEGRIEPEDLNYIYNTLEKFNFALKKSQPRN